MISGNIQHSSISFLVSIFLSVSMFIRNSVWDLIPSCIQSLSVFNTIDVCILSVYNRFVVGKRNMNIRLPSRPNREYIEAITIMSARLLSESFTYFYSGLYPASIHLLYRFIIHSVRS